MTLVFILLTLAALFAWGLSHRRHAREILSYAIALGEKHRQLNDPRELAKRLAKHGAGKRKAAERAKIRAMVDRMRADMGLEPKVWP